jgi:uncharacterized protein (DUF2236 family)
MARRVHGDRSVGLLYGQRALLIGALEPLTYTGTMLSTAAGDHPFTRLARTELFLLPREAVPPTYREFQAWFEARLASPQLHATDHALAMAPLIAFEQPVPRHARANLAVQNVVIKGTLPPRVREIFGIPWSAAHEASFQAIAAAHRRARRAFPRRARRGRNDYFFDVVTQAEKRRGGTPTPRLTSAS